MLLRLHWLGLNALSLSPFCTATDGDLWLYGSYKSQCCFLRVTLWKEKREWKKRQSGNCQKKSFCDITRSNFLCEMQANFSVFLFIIIINIIVARYMRERKNKRCEIIYKKSSATKEKKLYFDDVVRSEVGNFLYILCQKEVFFVALVAPHLSLKVAQYYSCVNKFLRGLRFFLKEPLRSAEFS